MTIRTMIVDDEPLAVERLQMLCAREPRLTLVGTASDGEAALRLIEGLRPDLVLLDIAMPLLDGIGVARALGGIGARMGFRPAVIFVTAFEGFAVEAFDLAAIDYLLKPVAHDRLGRAIDRVALALARPAGEDAPPPDRPPPDRPASDMPARPAAAAPEWAEEFWVPHRSELVRIAVGQIDRIEAERDYMRLFVGAHSYLLHQTISALESRLDPRDFVRLHRSHIVRRDHVVRLRHDGGGVWYACLADDRDIRIGRTFLANARSMTGR